jgi:protein-tyrosine phosphatase
VLPPRFEEFTFGLTAAGIVPILTHPERLTWIDGHYEIIQRLATRGVLMQVTAGSISGNFGRRARYWAERLLDEHLVDLLATDAHDANRRPPRLSEARELVATRCGEDVATALVVRNPLDILKNLAPSGIRSRRGDCPSGRPPDGLMPFGAGKGMQG